MRRFDRLLVGLLVLALIHVVLRDFSGSEPRRPAPEPAPRSERPLAPPSAGDPTVIVEAEPKRGNATGTAFSVAADGVWLTARHVTSSCRQVWLETAPRRGLPALRVVEHPGADIAVILTRRGAPALALSTRLGHGQEGFHFGFPGGRPGEAHSQQLLGRARLKTTGLRHTVEPVVAWAELRRHPGGPRRARRSERRSGARSQRRGGRGDDRDLAPARPRLHDRAEIGARGARAGGGRRHPPKLRRGTGIAPQRRRLPALWRRPAHRAHRRQGDLPGRASVDSPTNQRNNRL